jgi:hypothetical protein
MHNVAILSEFIYGRRTVLMVQDPPYQPLYSFFTYMKPEESSTLKMRTSQSLGGALNTYFSKAEQ